MSPPDLVHTLEAAAFAAWPAAEVRELDGWRLRFTAPGTTRRGNSVWPGAATGPLSLEARIEASVAFYAERGAPPRVQLTPASQPAGLDAALAGRGWEHEAGVSIQTAPAARLARGAEPGLEAAVSETLGDEWFHVAGVRSRFGGVQEAYRGFLARIGPAAGYALVRDGGDPVAAGLAVRDGVWVGLFSMFTLPEHRRRGFGRALVQATGRWAQARGAEHLYLQVERDNPAALALYAGAGFEEVYGYHYRRAPDAG